ncbi:MAG: CBS domain-containing protein [Actinomycetota bacterium]|nr:CBS domain-containing protein [Actinomycetota bacterium]
MRIHHVLESKGSDAVETIAPEATVRELVSRLGDHNVGALVVSEDGTTAVGIVSERDVVRRLRDGEAVLDASVATIMTTDIRVCDPDDTIEHLMQVMTDNRIRHVPVVRNGRLAGIISIGDVVKQRMSELVFERDQLNQYVSGAQ